MNRERSKALCVVHVFGVLAGALLFELFWVLSLLLLRGKWSDALFFTALIGGSVLNTALIAVDLVFFALGKEAIYKLCITLYVMSVFFSVAFYVLLKTGFLEIARDEESLAAYLERSGSWMSVMFTVLQFLQVVILPIPSTVTVVAGTALFGPLKGSLLSLLGIVIGSLTAFLIGRFAGTKVVSWLVGKETLENWLKKIKGKDKLLLTAMFLLPVFPDDVLCFVAGFSSMSVWYFLAVIVISRIFAIFTTSYSVSLIPFNTWWGILIWAVFFVLVAALFIVLYRKSDAILCWFEKKFKRATRVEEKPKKGEFLLEVVDPDGSLVSKGVKRGERDRPAKK